MTTLPAQADLGALLASMHRMVDGADSILQQGFGKVTASQKADGTLVTQTDHAVDAFLTTQLAAAYPDHAILSEECNTVYDPTVAFTWVIDPLDGTTNFARGLPIWGVSVALLYFGVPIVGMLSFVSLRECFAAIKGSGATLNDRPTHTANNLHVDDQHFIMLCTRTPRRYRIDTPLKPRILGSATYHLASVASGRALAGIESTPKLWDIAAALLILTEAGGCYHGMGANSSIFPLNTEIKHYAQVSFPLLAAANQTIMSEVEPCIAKYQ